MNFRDSCVPKGQKLSGLPASAGNIIIGSNREQKALARVRIEAASSLFTSRICRVFMMWANRIRGITAPFGAVRSTSRRLSTMRWAGVTGDAYSKLFDVARPSRKKRQINIDEQYLFSQIRRGGNFVYFFLSNDLFDKGEPRAEFTEFHVRISSRPDSFVALTLCVLISVAARRTRGLRRGCAG